MSSSAQTAPGFQRDDGRPIRKERSRVTVCTWQAGMMAVLAILFAGCEFFDHYDTGGSDLDENLEAVLVQASEGNGTSYFLLPESDDFYAIPQDPNNPVTPAKVELGKLLFHETGLLGNPKRPEGRLTASCASCHHAGAGFQARRRQGIGEGGLGFGVRGERRQKHTDYTIEELDVQPIRSPSAMNAAYQEVLLWNGQFGATGPNQGTEHAWTAGTPKETNHLGYQGLETQAVAGLDVHRMSNLDTSVVSLDSTYLHLFDAAFPGEPIDREQAGLAIAAYERTLLANQAPFQQWLRGRRGAMTERQKRGALLFFGEAQCATCHTGPALSSMTFHALGMGNLEGEDVFTGGPNELARPEDLGRGGFTGREEDLYAFKTPQLYNLTDSPFMGHGGTFRTVREVVEYKNRAVPENPDVPPARLATAFQPLHRRRDRRACGLYRGGALRPQPPALHAGRASLLQLPDGERRAGASGTRVLMGRGGERVEWEEGEEREEWVEREDEGKRKSEAHQVSTRFKREPRKRSCRMQRSGEQITCAPLFSLCLRFRLQG
ncbi:MAG: cytochrome-c peroxidase [Rhodothermales bacterium]